MERQESMRVSTKEEVEAPQIDVEGEDHQSQIDAFRLRLKKFMTTSLFGKTYTDALLVLSILSSVQFVYTTYLNPQGGNHGKQMQILDVVEKFIAALFSVDWLLSFFLADHKSEFVKSFFSMVDLLTVVPIWITSGFAPVAYNDVSTLFDVVLYLLYFLNTTRILRALRLHRKIMLIEDEVKRATANIILSVLVMLLFDAAMLQYLEDHVQPLDFHTWMYAMWVTISTVGFGDISPQSALGRVAIMCVIAFAIIQVPKMTNDLLAKMALTSVYARLFYIPKNNARHVIICGDLRSTEMREFFIELFHEDHDSSNTIALIVQPTGPSPEISAIMADPLFSINVMYLEGSTMLDRDLQRCCADSAVAIFVLTNKFSSNADEEDAKIILQQFSIKRYTTFHNPFTSPFFCLQLIRPDNQRHLETQVSRVSAFADADDDDNIVVCLNEIKMGIIAKSVMFPGASAFLMNLLLTIDDVNGDDGDNENADEEDEDDVGNWLDEYHHGCDWEIYSTKLGDVFTGRGFTETAQNLYSTKGIVLIGVQVRDITGKAPTRILLNPKDYVLPSKLDYEVTAYVIAQNKATSDLSMKKEEEGDPNAMALQRLQLSVPPLPGLSEPPPAVSDDVYEMSEGRSAGSMARGGQEEAGVSKDGVGKAIMGWQKMLRKYDVEKNANESMQERLQKIEDEYIRANFFIRDKQATLSECTIQSSVQEEIPHLNNHVIVLGRGISNLYDLIRPLRAKALGTAKCIVIVSQQDIPHAVWQRISMFQGIFFIRGSALDDNDLRRAGIFRAAQVVVLADSQAMQTVEKLVVGDIAMLDADSTFSLQAVRRLNERAQCVVEIVKHENIAYLDPDATAQGGYRFTSHFAAGTLFTTSMLDTLACQVFYNPQIIKLLHKLISSGDQRNKAEMAALAELGKKAPVGLSAVVSSALYQQPIPDGLESRTYGALFRFLSKSGVIPVGLYRGVFPQMKVGPKHNKLPYVYTNPTKDTELFSCDKVFVLSPHMPAKEKAVESQRELEAVQEELVKIRMNTRGSMEATTAAMRDQFHVFGANQDIMQRHVDQLTSDIKTRLIGVNKQVAELKEGFAAVDVNLDISTPVRKGSDGMGTSSNGNGRSNSITPGRQRTAGVSPSRTVGNRARSGQLSGSRGESLLLSMKGQGRDRKGSNVSMLSVASMEEYDDSGARGENFSRIPSPSRPGSSSGEVQQLAVNSPNPFSSVKATNPRGGRVRPASGSVDSETDR